MLSSSLHELMKFWFELVRDGGYAGVVLLMAMESSIFPVPSEIVVPPAAFWAAQGKLDFWGVIFAATLGSYLGAAITYYVAKWLGLPFVRRYGRYFFLGEEKLVLASKWVAQYSVFGIFWARLLPVVRHLISIPAGILGMNFRSFSAATILGSFIWCVILAYFGKNVIGAQPELLDSPEAMVAALKMKLHAIILGIVALGVCYVAVVAIKKRLLVRK